MILKWIKGYRTTPEIKIRTGKFYLFRNGDEIPYYGIRVKDGVLVGWNRDHVPNCDVFKNTDMLVPFPQKAS